MGPCLFRHGNLSTCHRYVNSAWLQWGRAFSGTEIYKPLAALLAQCSLQWGRAFSGTEIDKIDDFVDTVFVASMGPCLFRHGNYIWYGKNPNSMYASMGPCLFRHGNGSMGKGICRLLDASMGPCLFRHGNTNHVLDLLHHLYLSFNGAVPFQARK